MSQGEDNDGKVFDLLAILLFVVALIGGGLAIWFHKASRAENKLIISLKKQVEELSKRPEQCEDAREPTSMRREVCAPTRCEPKICEPAKKEIVYINKCEGRKLSSLELDQELLTTQDVASNSEPELEQKQDQEQKQDLDQKLDQAETTTTTYAVNKTPKPLTPKKSKLSPQEIEQQTKAQLEERLREQLEDPPPALVAEQKQAAGKGRNPSGEEETEACVGQKLVLKNREILENTTIGNSTTCEIKLPLNSYVRVIGNVKLIARKIIINGVIDGNALADLDSNAGTLELSAVEHITISGSVDLRGSALPVKNQGKRNRAFASVPSNGGQGGTLLLNAKEVDLIGVVNVGGAQPPKQNGIVKIASQKWESSIILVKNILNAKKVMRLPYVERGAAK